MKALATYYVLSLICVLIMSSQNDQHGLIDRQGVERLKPEKGHVITKTKQIDPARNWFR